MRAAVLLEDPVVSVRTDGDHALVGLNGEVDGHNAPVVEEHLTELIDGGSRFIVADVAELSFIDVKGLATLARASVRVQAEGGLLVLRSPTRNLSKVIDIAGLRGFLPAE